MPEIPDDTDRLYFINTKEFIQIPADEPSMEFKTISIDKDKVTMQIIAKLPRFFMKRVIINE